MIHNFIYHIFPGYGNIAPKTNWGRVVTMVYAIFGMPLFLMWASQMGTLLAQSFQFFYSNICCVVCRRGKRKRAAAKAAKRQNELLALEKQQQQELAEQQQQFKMPLVLESENEKMKGVVTGNGNLKRGSDSVGASPAKPKALENLLSKRGGSDSGHHSQASLEGQQQQRNGLPQINLPPEMMDPGAKDILATCARYLEQSLPVFSQSLPW